MSLPDCYGRYRDELEAELRAAVAAGSSPLHDMMQYHLGWVDETGRSRPSSGKLARPMLCLLACEAAGGDWHAALPAAAAIELLHNFSLIHDDIQDRSWERRGRSTVWKVWGEAQGINAGDAMYAVAQLTMLGLGERGVRPDLTVLLARQLNLTSIQLCEGQYLDIDYESRLDIGVEHYLDMIGKKTARLFELALYSGALLGTDNPSRVSSLRSFGWNLGMAFQVQNDLLGIWGEGEGGKKSPYTDIRYRKKILPAIYALEEAQDGDRQRLAEIYSRQELSDEDVAEVLRILDVTGARAYSEGVRRKYHLQGIEDVKAAGIGERFQQELADMAAFLLG